MADDKIKVRNGVKVFTRMADNAGAVTTGIVDVMNQLKEKYPVLEERMKTVNSVMSSSSNNYIYSKDVFSENKEPKQATRVLEFYITWTDIKESYIVHMSADMGSNQVTFAAGFETLEEMYPWASPFTEAMNAVVGKVIDDMDDLIDEEDMAVRKMAYTNIIKRELDKKIKAHEPELRTITWPNEKTSIVESCLVNINKLSDDPVDIFPVLDFGIEVGDNEGVPLFNLAVRIKDPKRKDPVDNTDVFVSFHDTEESTGFTEYVLTDHGYEEYYPLVKTVLKEVMIPIAETVFPELATLQRAIIDQTVSKIDQAQKNKS